MRILQIIPDIAVSSGGVPRVVVDLSLTLSKAGNKVCLVSLSQSGESHLNVPSQPDLHLQNLKSLTRLGFLKSEKEPAIREMIADAEVVHFHGLWQPAYSRILKLCRFSHKPVVLTVHGMLAPWSMRHRWLKKRIYHFLIERHLISGCSALHFTAALEREKASPWIPAKHPTVVIPPAFFLDEYTHLGPKDAYRSLLPEISSVGRYILFLGRLHPVKGIEKLIQGFAQFAATSDDVSLVIAGPGDDSYRQSLMTLARVSGVAERVIFIPTITGEKKLSLYRGATLFVSASYQENFGMVFAESMACETPVMMTEGVDIYPDIVQNNIGFVTTPDAGAVAAKLREALVDRRDELEEMGKRGRKWVFDTLSPAVVAQRWIDAYQSVIDSNAAST